MCGNMGETRFINGALEDRSVLKNIRTKKENRSKLAIQFGEELRGIHWYSFLLSAVYHTADSGLGVRLNWI